MNNTNDIPPLDFKPVGEQMQEIALKALRVLKNADINERVTITVNASGVSMIYFGRHGDLYVKGESSEEFKLLQKENNTDEHQN